MTSSKTFRDLGLSEATLKALEKKGFVTPTGIQGQCIPLLLKNDTDIIGQAQTGTGKTAAFGLPILELIDPNIKDVQLLVLTPTRELAIQVAEELGSYTLDKNIKITTIYGGQSYTGQLRSLRDGTQIVVGTPGRTIDHIEKKRLILNKVKFVVLDEADEMLNMGFIDDIDLILSKTPTVKRMLLFSATMPRKILGLVKKYMPNYKHIEIDKEQITVNLTEQVYYEVKSRDKFEALCRIIDIEPDFYGLIFCRTRSDVDDVTHKLTNKGYSACGIHGEIVQSQREKIFKRFKNKHINILVATDVAARGIDVSDLTHVINYALPEDAESYIHRIGRTGRAGKKGVAITLITASEHRKFEFIKRFVNVNIKRKSLPSIADIIKIKKERIFEDLKGIIADENLKTFSDITKKLLEEYDKEKIISALLKKLYASKLEEDSYETIEDVVPEKRDGGNFTVRGDCARLFFTIGKRDRLLKRDLVELIKMQTGVGSQFLNDIEIFDTYSFVSVPHKEADIILKKFKFVHRGRKVIVEKAKLERR